MKASIILLGTAAVLCCLFFGDQKTKKLRAIVTLGMFILLALLCAGCNTRATSDELGTVGTIKARIDPVTGCQYITYAEGGITPRMGADGKQICREVAK